MLETGTPDLISRDPGSVAGPRSRTSAGPHVFHGGDAVSQAVSKLLGRETAIGGLWKTAGGVCIGSVSPAGDLGPHRAAMDAAAPLLIKKPVPGMQLFECDGEQRKAV